MRSASGQLAAAVALLVSAHVLCEEPLSAEDHDAALCDAVGSSEVSVQDAQKLSPAAGNSPLEGRYVGEAVITGLAACEDNLACMPPYAIRVQAADVTGGTGLAGVVTEFKDDIFHGNFASMLDPDPVALRRYHDCDLGAHQSHYTIDNDRTSRLLTEVFQAISRNSPLAVGLSRFDLFRGLIFRTRSTVGIHFAAREFPAYEPGIFPYYLGLCQIHSNLDYKESEQRMRHFIWLPDHNSLWMLNTRNLEVEALVSDWRRPTFPIEPGTFGATVSWIYFLEGHITAAPSRAYEPSTEDAMAWRTIKKHSGDSSAKHVDGRAGGEGSDDGGRNSCNGAEMAEGSAGAFLYYGATAGDGPATT